MGNSMAYTSGAEASARRTVPNHAQQTAGRTHDSSLHVSTSVSAPQPTDTVQELANAVNPHTGPSVRYEESLGNRDKASKNPEPVIREDNNDLSVGLPSDSGYGPSLWTVAGRMRRSRFVTVAPNVGLEIEMPQTTGSADPSSESRHERTGRHRHRHREESPDGRDFYTPNV